MGRWARALLLGSLAGALFSTGCSLGSSPSGYRGGFPASAAAMALAPVITLLPFTNNSKTFSASRSAETILENRLRVAGYQPASLPADVAAEDAMLNSRSAKAPDAVPAAVRKLGNRYAITGNIEDWRAQDINGARPRVNVELSLHDLETNKVVWTGRDEETGTVNSTLTALADEAIGDLVARIPRQLVEAANRGNSPAVAGNEPTLGSALSGTLTGSSGATAAGNHLGKDGFLKVGSQPMQGRSVAIFYGFNPPVDQLSLFDRLILEPDAIKADELKALTASGAVPYAYLSIGEVGPDRNYASQIKTDWVLGENKTWKSKVFDLRNAELGNFLLSRVNALVKAGYSGLFLDTMDSYQLFAKTPEARQQQESALTGLIARIKQQHPSIRLIANRGFEVLEKAAPYLEAVAAESLYASWDNNAQEYVDVKGSDREWLLAKLQTAKDQYKLDVISIEYLPPARRKEAVAVAKVVAAHGFIPWVATPALDYVGVGLVEPVPRKVMFLYDKRINGPDWEAEVHKLLAVPVEYLGLVPDYHDMSEKGLPSKDLRGRYAAVMSWTYSSYDVPGYQEWVEHQFDNGQPFVTFGHPGFDITPSIAKKMGVSAEGKFDFKTAKVAHRDRLIGFERELLPRVENFSVSLKSSNPQNKVHLAYTDAAGAVVDAVVSGEWGGYAVHPAVADFDIDGVVHWILDPYKFIETALELEGVPMPDVSTENGKRLFLAHIDGDALPSWAEMPGRKLGAEVIHERILKPYDLPHTISVVVGEMIGFPQYADRWPKMYKVARDIFAMPNVEIATHTYSHPFKWQKVANHKGSGKYNLKLDGYQFSAEQEIYGSAEFIDTKLAPPGKKTEVFLWSGDALPTEDVIAEVYKSGLVNLNGGNTVISGADASLSQMNPMVRMVGKYAQIYAPIMNENVFTNDWTGPFDGFRRVIDTLELSNKPRRIKPLNIYYHFYAGTKIAAIRSLEDIYEWTVTQDINPVYVSDYSVKVPDFRKAGIGRYLDGTWKATGLGTVRTLRVVDGTTFPQMASSRHISGAKKLHDGVYIHTDGADNLTFRLGEKEIAVPHLVSSNGRIEHWSQEGSSVKFRVSGKVPVEVELGGNAVASCGVTGAQGRIKGEKSASGTYLFKFKQQDTGDVRINCQA